MPRGYFGIGIENGKTKENVGTLWRTAHLLGASFIFTIGDRYKHQASDTTKAWKHVPFFQYDSFDHFLQSVPRDCQLIGVELDERAKPLKTFEHPERCVYLLGAEDWGLSKEAIARCHELVVLPGEFSMNVAAAGSIVLYDRFSKAA